MSSSSETYVNSDDGSISEEFHKHFWKYAIGGIIVILLGLMAYKIISVLLNNPLTNAVNQLVGDVGLLLKDFTQGCCEQSKCPNITTTDECKSACGCGWDDKGGKCNNTTGATANTGGPFTFKCPLFLTAFVGACAWLFVKMVGGIYSAFKDRPSKKDLDALARTTAEKTGDIIDRWRNGVDIAYEKWKKGQDGKEYDAATAEYAAKRVVQTKYNQQIVQKLKDVNSDQWKSANENAQKEYNAAKKAASDAGVDTDAVDQQVEDAAGKDPVQHGV